MRKLLPTLTTACLLGLATHVAAQGYKVTPLVTDDPSVLATLGYGPAATVDPNLINPWGFDHSPTGPWVVANAFGTGATGVAGGVLGTGTRVLWPMVVGGVLEEVVICVSR